MFAIFFYKKTDKYIVKTVDRAFCFVVEYILIRRLVMKEKLVRFLSGRYCMYGVDAMTWALLAAYIILEFISGFFSGVVVRLVLKLSGAAFAVFAIYRLLSKKSYSRTRENAAFLRFWKSIKQFFKLQFDRIKNIKTKRYRKCPECKAVLQLPVPKKKGTNTVVCPKCGKRFSVFNIF